MSSQQHVGAAVRRPKRPQGTLNARLGSQEDARPLPPGSKALLYGLYPCLLVVAVFFCTYHPISDPDTWFHMAFGRHVLSHGALPGKDLFTCTAADKLWISSGWAPSLLLYWLYERSGLGSAGPLLLTVAVIAAAYLSIYFVAVRGYANRGSIVLVLLAGVLGSYPRFAPRPDIFSQLLVVWVVLLLVRAEDAMKSSPQRLPLQLWLLPPLMLVWANLHVGFLAGLLPLGVYACWQAVCWLRTRKRGHLLALAPLALAAVAWTVNPYGTAITELVGRNKAIDQWRHNFEWMPLIYFPHWDFSWRAFSSCNLSWHLLGAIGVMLLLVGWAVCRRFGQCEWWKLAIAAGFLFSGLSQRRQMGLAALVLPAVCIAQLGVLDGLLARKRALLPSCVIGAALLICLMRLGGQLNMRAGWPCSGVEELVLPTTLSDFLKKNPAPTNTFATYNYGGYMLYELGEQPKLFMDGRLDLFGPKVWDDYWSIFEKRQEIGEVASRYGINTVVLDARDAYRSSGHLVNQLSAMPEWKLVYFDDVNAAFVRQTPQNAAYTKAHGFEVVSPYTQEHLGEALADPKGRELARQEAARAVEISKGSAVAHALAAVIEMQLGNMQAAEAHRAAAQKRDPTIDIALPTAKP